MQSISFKSNLIPLEKTYSGLSVQVEGSLTGSILKLHYTLRAEELRTLGLSAFNWEKTTAGFSETLWKKTCFEIFIADPSTARYWEWNFAPDAWGAFSFAAPRARCPIEARKDAGLRLITSDDSKLSVGLFSLFAEVDLSFSEWLAWTASSASDAAKLLVSLNAITDSAAGERVHWALKHAANGKADFHERAHFVELQKLIS